MDQKETNKQNHNKDQILEDTPSNSIDRMNEIERAKRRKKILKKEKRKKIFTGILVFVLCIYMVIGVVGGKFVMEKMQGIPQLNIKDLLSE